jgi:hypothetical protein
MHEIVDQYCNLNEALIKSSKLDPGKLYDIFNNVELELLNAMNLHPTFYSAHHGYAVLKEEVDEAWDEIKRNDPKRAREEMIQVAAMAIRFLHDLEEEG